MTADRIKFRLALRLERYGQRFRKFMRRERRKRIQEEQEQEGGGRQSSDRPQTADRRSIDTALARIRLLKRAALTKKVNSRKRLERLLHEQREPSRRE